jgi:hypothetical protein
MGSVTAVAGRRGSTCTPIRDSLRAIGRPGAGDNLPLNVTFIRSPLGVRNSIDAQLEINRAHYAIAELFFYKRLECGAENLRDFVEAIN